MWKWLSITHQASSWTPVNSATPCIQLTIMSLNDGSCSQWARSVRREVTWYVPFGT